MPSPLRPRVTPVKLSNEPLSLKPTIAEIQAQHAAELGANGSGPPIAVPVHVTDAWLSLGWVMGHGLPHSLRRAHDAAQRIMRIEV